MSKVAELTYRHTHKGTDRKPTCELLTDFATRMTNSSSKGGDQRHQYFTHYFRTQAGSHGDGTSSAAALCRAAARVNTPVCKQCLTGRATGGTSGGTRAEWTSVARLLMTYEFSMGRIIPASLNAPCTPKTSSSD